MHKKFEALIICCLFISSFFLARAGAAYVSAKTTGKLSGCIVLDAGHGGSDPGKVGCNDVLEKNINLAIVYKLKTLFENKGFEVVLTRTDDKPLVSDNSKNMKIEDMRNRVALITETMPLMTISIHQNSFSASTKGAQVFYHKSSEKGKRLAGILQQSIKEKADKENHRVEKANDSYYMLRKVSCPIVIVECGFLSNPDEERLLNDEKYQKKMVEGIAEGIENFLYK